MSINYYFHCEAHLLAPILAICQKSEGLEIKYIHVVSARLMYIGLVFIQCVLTVILYSSLMVYVAVTVTVESNNFYFQQEMS